MKQRPPLTIYHSAYGIMEYYLRFLEAILLLKVGYPRVTHPFAAIRLRLNPDEQARQNSCKVRSLDLHALSTPPAFTLSQDQTLQRLNLRGISKNYFGNLETKKASQRMLFLCLYFNHPVIR